MDGTMRTGLKILHIIFFLLLLGSGDFQVRGLTVTGKDDPTEALRGEDVTIPCLLSGVPIPLNLQKLSVIWTQILLNGTEFEVYRFRSSHHQSWRNGSHMNDRDLLQGNASLSIPNIQIEDEGDYRCFVIITPDSGTTTSTLHVSVKPQTTLSHSISIYFGYFGSVFCDVSNFYPEAVNFRWVKYSTSNNVNSTLDRFVSLKIPLRNSDGTFNVTSVLTVSTDVPGDIISCIVSHRSLKEEITLNFTVPEQSRFINICEYWIFLSLLPITQILRYLKRGWRPWISVFHSVFIICSIFIHLYILHVFLNINGVEQWRIYFFFIWMILNSFILFFYGKLQWRYFKKGEPTISGISGGGCIPHMKRTTLTCQITNFKLKEIQINVYLKRYNEIKKHLIASWKSTDQTSFNNSSNDLIAGGQRGNNVDALPLLEGAASRTLLPVEMEAEIRKSWTGKYNCLCSITITPSADTDNGTILGVEVEHTSLKWPISVFTVLNVYEGKNCLYF
ncbi:natural cytotoxicity triggering receptor 3 ligand 1-like [Aquarana catesbeiana]|uniref:natural cytotoxicity triggering receptor 3 ligand 1-like n=1 Tax=Aquarana catesbeiana TaxID=8400 RepID=UPI003CC9982C